MTFVTATELVLGVLGLCVVVAWQLRGIVHAEYPGLRAVEALAFTVPLFVLLFATAYFLMEHTHAASFTQQISRVDAMYFSATIFTTVGFGDISAKTEAAQVVVTAQMMLDLVILGLVVRLVVNAVKIGKQRRRA
jgi:voltage-gated potassium channel Kch